MQKYSEKTAVIILTHKKGYDIKKVQAESIEVQNKDRFLVYYLQGDAAQSQEVIKEGNVLTFNIPDNYESLPMKVYFGIRYIKENHPDIDGVFKCDDNNPISLDELQKALDGNPDKYWGVKVHHPRQGYWSSAHYGKCEDQHLSKEVQIYIGNHAYCAGHGYYLHSSLFDIIIGNKDCFANGIYEDYEIGKLLSGHGVYPAMKHYNIIL